MVKFAGEHLLLVINDLLDISKIDQGKLDFHRVVFDLVRFVYVVNFYYWL